MQNTKEPRKVIVGTTLFSVFEEQRPYVSLERRLEEISLRVKEMSEDAQSRYQRGIDLAVFPENALNPLTGATSKKRSVLFTTEVRRALGEIARRERTWLVVCFNMREENDPETVFNASVLFDREGQVAGIYRKVYCLADKDGFTVEGGKQPGQEIPVFETDFGKVAMMICFDMGFDDLAEIYKQKGAEIILWSTMSPQTMVPRMYARRFGFHIVTSTPRSNASVIDPLGDVIAQTCFEGVATAEIDLEYRIVHWQAELRDGKTLLDRFGTNVGFRYDANEDYGIFWSNDPNMPITEMLKMTGILTDAELRTLARETRKSLLEKIVT
ncbi:MAG: carbon-nitrogen hydrolase family protein [Chthoniobacterales bacterium]